MPVSGSVFGVTFDDKDIRDGRIKDLEFEWHFPMVEDEIWMDKIILLKYLITNFNLKTIVK